MLYNITMRYTDISRIMSDKGLSSEPAFQYVTFVLEPISCNNGCPLGLYDADDQTIILPTDFTEGALLHELGHRYEHYYHGRNLSEDFAESFRNAYSGGGRTLLTYQPADKWGSLTAYESLFQEGDRGAVEMHFSKPLSDDQILLAFSRLSQYPLKYTYNPNQKFLRVEFTKGMPWLPVIMGIGAVMIAGMLGFGIFKVEEQVANKLIPLALIAGGTFILYGLATRR